MTRSQLVAAAAAFIGFCALHPCTSKTETLQDLINEACAPTHYPLLPPCGKGITLEELNSRLHYKLKMMKAENEQMNIVMSYWEKSLGMLYSSPYTNDLGFD
jgi:hypothetical protein